MNDASDRSTSPTGPGEATFDDIRQLLVDLPGPDLEAGVAAAAREGELTKPAGSLGRLEEIAHWMCLWQGRYPPRVDHPRVCVFAGNHGVAARGVSAYPSNVTAQMVQNFVSGGGAVNQLAAMAEADLRVYEMALDQPTADFTQGPAMDEAECARAITYGMMAVEDGIELLALGEMGIGNTTAAAAICHALQGGDASDWTGPGTGVAGAVLDAKIAAVSAGVSANKEDMSDPLHVLRCLGGQEIAAIVGAVIAARVARVPVLLDGYTCTAAAAVLHAIDPALLDHCLVAHLSAEPAHRDLALRLGKRPLLDLDMRLGEASGAALAINIVRAAVACHTGMATFEEAAVSGRDTS
ncbi:MAG: nicotinate-nucleotide--dimethylbenzimidazole phosphoribosyltransferase [Alphaproteobacteria bacterium]|nr:nicotinate-nucleotide--dimethylbenzimidazole phosphoribosyltransferase [Alphaproteobacteria bacterium]